MTHWNYRIINHGGYMALHEVHYDEFDEPILYTENPADFVSDFGTTEECRQDIIASLEQALEDARMRDILDVDEFDMRSV